MELATLFLFLSIIWQPCCNGFVVEDDKFPTREFELRMPKADPKEPETYLCTPLKLDKQNTYYIVGFEPRAEKKTAHHMLLYGCKTPGRYDPVFNCGAMTVKQEGLNSAMNPCGSGSSIIYAWAQNAPKLKLPKDVAFRVGGSDSGIDYLVLQLMFCYNLGLSFVNVFCFLGFVQSLRNADSLFDKKLDPFLSQVYFIYWITKIVELLDTVFMVLRHKFLQISALHVYHHASMILLSELGYTKYAWAAFSMPLMLNALVHVVLYLYYGLTAIGYQPSWKKRLTEMQIVQFCIDMVHAGYGFWHHNFCFWSLLYGSSMLYLFTTFYVNAYLRSSPRQQQQQHSAKQKIN